jgi:hypothetical protein
VLPTQPNRRSFARDRHLAFAALIVDRLRDGMQPSPRALEQAPFLEQWVIVRDRAVFELTGHAWRLPLRRTAFSAPLLAINQTAGWARTLHEWVVIGDPERPCAANAVEPGEVTRRAEIWIRRQIAAADEAKATASHCANDLCIDTAVWI